MLAQPVQNTDGPKLHVQSLLLRFLTLGLDFSVLLQRLLLRISHQLLIFAQALRLSLLYHASSEDERVALQLTPQHQDPGTVDVPAFGGQADRGA